MDTPDPDAPDVSCSFGASVPCEKRLRCKTPPGVGSNNDVVIVIGSSGVQEAASRGNWLVLAYRPPVIQSVHADLPPLDEGPGSMSSGSFYPMGLQSDHADVSSDTAGVPTTGGIVELRGAGFGTQAYSVAEATMPALGLLLQEASPRTADGAMRLIVPPGLGHSFVI